MKGFTKYLTGELEYDGKTIADDAKWSEDDLKSITYSGAMNWSRSDTKTAYESLLGDASNTGKYQMVLCRRLMNLQWVSLSSSGAAESTVTKEKFLGNAPYLMKAVADWMSFMQYFVKVNPSPRSQIRLGGIVSVTYSRQ